MLINQVAVFPTVDTLNYFQSLFQTCPFPVDFTSCRVILNESENLSVIKPEAVYSAIPVTLDYWYDSIYNATSLILVLQSPSMYNRMIELRNESGTLFHPEPLIFMPILRYMPQLKSNYRAFVRSVSDIIVNNKQSIFFTGEMQLPTEIEGIPDGLFYESYGLS